MAAGKKFTGRGTFFFRGGNVAKENNLAVLWQTLFLYRHRLRQATSYGYERVFAIFDFYESAEKIPVTETIIL